MIIQVAGTNGSGKSTVVRCVIEAGAAVHVVGTYDGPVTGGCDQLDPEEAYRRIEAAALQHRHVLFEGSFVMNQTRGPALLARLGMPFTVVVLTTPLGVCIDSINQRRSVRSVGGLSNKRNVENNYRRTLNYAARMRDAGAHIMRTRREDAPTVVLGLLRGL